MLRRGEQYSGKVINVQSTGVFLYVLAEEPVSDPDTPHKFKIGRFRGSCDQLLEKYSKYFPRAEVHFFIPYMADDDNLKTAVLSKLTRIKGYDCKPTNWVRCSHREMFNVVSNAHLPNYGIASYEHLFMFKGHFSVILSRKYWR